VDNFFVFNGRGTREFGMSVEKRPTQKTPKRRRETISVPGRNGDLHFDEDTFENVEAQYEVWFRGELPTPEQAHAVKSWLLAPKGYSRLEDKYDPFHFRLASFAGPMDVADILGRYGRCKIKFDCDPRCFLKSGEFQVDLENGGRIYNPTAFPAQPLIYVYGNGAGSLTVAGVTVTINAMTTGMLLDCENELARALGEVGQSLDGDIYAPEFPELQPGANRVVFDGGVTAVKIVPRWWEP
jgi:phage-related protein